MGNDLSRNAEKEVAVAEVVRYGDKLVIPDGMKYPVAIDLIHRRMKFEEETVELNETFLAFPWDGAYAFEQVLVATFGWAPSETKPGGFFQPPQPPQLISVEVSPGVFKSVPWGMFSLPTVNGTVECTVNRVDGMVRFALQATVKRKDESTIKKLYADLREHLKKHSIYRGQAIKLRFRDDDGEQLGMPEPKFIDTRAIDPGELIYSRAIEQAIETNLFTPIRRVADCLLNNIPVKRGVLLGGAFGTGKTLGARIAAKHAVDHGLTYITVLRADELQDAIQFARLYGDPACVLFCEDIDRALGGERSVKIDDILNTLDGVDSKHLNLITVLTTNNLDNINAAMLRPGRLDAIIEVLPPDAEAVERLIRRVAGSALLDSEDITAACIKLEGNVPAVLTEVVKRAKLSQLARQEPGTLVERLTGEALDDAAYTMIRQNELLQRASAPKPGRPTLDEAFTGAVKRAVGGDTVNEAQPTGLQLKGKVALSNGLTGTVTGPVQ
jgi:transitional endoplasmic reticulum ATPase